MYSTIKKTVEMPIVLVLMLLCFSVFSNSSENCECDLLLIDSDDQSSQHSAQYFTRQSETIKGQPFYYSLSGDTKETGL